MKIHTCIPLIIFLSTLAAPLTLQAGDHPGKKKTLHRIERIVTDLTTTQKKKIEQLSKESNERLQKLEMQQRRVRDSIRMYMDRYEDNSSTLFPLFDRESRLQAEINKEMYRTKTSINKVLTPQQHEKLIQHVHKHKSRKNAKTRNATILEKSRKNETGPDPRK